jgi:hypothetical protein
MNRSATPTRYRIVAAILFCSVAMPGTASAHSFGQIYNLPIPLWMYLCGAAAALLVSFLITGWFLQLPDASAVPRGSDLTKSRWVGVMRMLRLRSALRGLSVLLLLLCVVTGFFGTTDAYRNFNMTFFWVVFILGFSYLSAVIGNIYSTINPWLVLCEWLEGGVKSFTAGRWRYPAWLAYWPALALYMGFIWIELFTFNQPRSLAVMLSSYTVLNILGVWLIGKRAWFKYCEFLSVFMRLIALMAPLHYCAPEQTGKRGQLRWRMPFAGLIEARAESWSLLVFVLFMLSSTAFDGLHVTAPWFNLFWNDPFGMLQALLGKPALMYFETLHPYYRAYESLFLLLSPFLYLAVYLLFITLAKWLTRSKHTLRELALGFGFSLLPIALVYHITHYFTLIPTQGVKIVSLASDPFGWGWNLFGTAGFFRTLLIPDMAWIWHSQVALILFGHIVSVVLAHHEALRLFPTRRQAALSQLPMLFLMVLFTSVGLWILTQPIK